ncbi:hypothetical protein ONS96_008726 [Cadophora gregata f. sp. sojae]|nr:hypothetical protein ONS96_008726 [Cadophora gregata f. sp. sojae]
MQMDAWRYMEMHPFSRLPPNLHVLSRITPINEPLHPSVVLCSPTKDHNIFTPPSTSTNPIHQLPDSSQANQKSPAPRDSRSQQFSRTSLAAIVHSHALVLLTRPFPDFPSRRKVQRSSL